jgi:hypothetical protein
MGHRVTGHYGVVRPRAGLAVSGLPGDSEPKGNKSKFLPYEVKYETSLGAH